jgi:hypothetical protein
MALSDIFSTSFFLTIGIVLILVGVAGMYFSQLILQQNQKISGMVDLISTMAQEMDFIRSRIQFGGVVPNNNNNIHTISMNHGLEKSEEGLIEVSDDEDEDDEDDEDEDDEDEDEDDEEDEEDDEASLEENDEDYLNKTIIISSLNLDNTNEDKSENIKIINLGGSCEGEEGEDIDDSSSSSSDDEPEQVSDFSIMDNLSILKSIDVDDFKPDNSTVDYKKLSMDKLKALVLEKKLSENASKLKKHELIKLLEESK